MLDLSPIVTRLREQLVGWKHVGLTLDEKLSYEQIKQYPSLYVQPALWRFGPERASTGVHTQPKADQFDLVYFLSSTGIGATSNKRSERVQDEAARLTEEARSALIGWTWSDRYAPIRGVSGKLHDIDTARMVLIERFETDATYRVIGNQ